MAHEVESLFSAREVPWHRIGVVTPDVLKASEAIVAAGLDWTVDKYPIYDKQTEFGENGFEDKYVEIPDRFALKRSIDQQLMSIVSDKYRPFQNTNAFEFMDALTGTADAKYETAGSLRHGRVVFVSLRMENSDFTVAGEDLHQTYLLLRTTHDGSGRISVYVVTVRVVCMNTLTWAINGARHSWGVTHTADVAGKIAEAREALGLTAQYTEAFQAEAEALLSVKITDDDLQKLLDGTLQERPTKEAEIELIMDNYRSSATVANFLGTGWGAVNAVSEYEEHVKKNASGEALFSRLLDGRDAKLRTTLKDQLLASV